MDTSKAVTHLGLCAGYGGIELGLKRAIPSLRSIALCEVEAFAIANLVAKMESGQLEPAPIWPNLKTFPWGAFRDRVDILTGGYPCQPFSAAGQRKGKQDPRHLWPWIADGIRLLRPRICFFENVEGHISLGLSDVIEDLAGMGYRTTWGIFSASEVGAPHQRKRVFILAVASGFRGAPGLSGSFPRYEGQSGEFDDGGYQGMADTECGGFIAGRNNAGQSQRSEPEHCSAWPSRPGEQQYGWEPPRVVAHSDTGTRSPKHKQQKSSQRGETTERSATQPIGSSAMADSHRIHRSEQAEGREHDRQARPAGEAVMADTISGWGQQAGSQCGSSEVAADSRRQEGAGHQQAVIPDDQGSNGVIRQTEPPLGGDPDGSAGGLDYAELCVTCDNRTDELRLLGNGVVPATAERAFRTLIRELL
jgi:DNA (cytosine-5)-methyltransferase 1